MLSRFFFRFCLTLLPFSVTINQSELIKWWFLFCSEWLLLSVAMFLWPDYFLVWFVFLSNCASSKISKNIILFLLLPSDFDSCLDVDVAVDVPLFFLNISAYLLVVVVVKKITLQYQNSDNKTQSIHVNNWTRKKSFERNEIVSKHTFVDETMYICLLLTETCLRNCRCWVELSKRFIFSSPRSFAFPFLPVYICYCFICRIFFRKNQKPSENRCWYIMLWLWVSILIPGFVAWIAAALL